VIGRCAVSQLELGRDLLLTGGEEGHLSRQIGEADLQLLHRFIGPRRRFTHCDEDELSLGRGFRRSRYDALALPDLPRPELPILREIDESKISGTRTFYRIYNQGYANWGIELDL